jgi:hypothetical protein
LLELSTSAGLHSPCQLFLKPDTEEEPTCYSLENLHSPSCLFTFEFPSHCLVPKTNSTISTLFFNHPFTYRPHLAPLLSSPLLSFSMISDWRNLACSLLLSAATILGSPLRARSAYSVKDTYRVPSRWTKIGVPSANHMVRLTIGLKQSRFDELERHLNEGNWHARIRTCHLKLRSADSVLMAGSF